MRSAIDVGYSLLDMRFPTATRTHPVHRQTNAQAIMAKHGVHPGALGPLSEGRSGLFSNYVLQGIADKHSRSIASVVPGE